jgi:hypothetical protein
VLDPIGARRFHATVGAAVHAHIEEHRVEWRDWEDEPRTPRA